MPIAIIGAGAVGATLGQAWLDHGQDVIWGLRNPADPKYAALAKERLKAPAEAVKEAEIVVIATPWSATQAAVKSLGSLAGKIVIDCTNPFAPGLTGLDAPAGGSGAEAVASWAPGARVVKAFNTTGFNIMANPAFPEGPATMFYCGDDASAKRAVHGLAAELGFDPIDAGPLSRARVLENMALLWVSLAMGGVSGGTELGRDIAFRLARRKPAA